MTEAPEKIWAYTGNKTRCGIWRSDDDRAVAVEYVRADVADTLRAEVARLRERVEIADARFAEHGMDTMTARLEEYGYDHEAKIHQLATYRAALQAHGEPDA
jgi:hypothetical protein